jgi:tetratricopeptide (TPR) repeat protein
LRLALRFSVRAFAEHLGVAIRTVSKWEAAGASRQPRPDMQAAFDTVLANADSQARARFDELQTSTRPGRSKPQPLTRWDNESWIDDLDRARLYADRQNFALASRLVERWLGRAAQVDLDESSLYLQGRSLVLLGNLQRDQGELVGPGSARSAYVKALETFAALKAVSRIGQVELLLTVVSEMSGEIEQSARAYQVLADDQRLNPLDRARARLWIGTAVTKSSRLSEEKVDVAIGAIGCAVEEFESLDEPDEWSVAHQKLALAHLAAGNPDAAHRYMDVAVANGRDDSPLHRVKLDTARAHILLADKATRESAFVLLERSRTHAIKHKLTHQVASIDRISRLADDGRIQQRAGR